jgi:hypothetical protein
MYYLDNNINFNSKYTDCAYAANPIITERTKLHDLAEIYHLKEDKKHLLEFCEDPKGNRNLLNKMHYRTLILLTEKIQELNGLKMKGKKLTRREMDSVEVGLKVLGRYLIHLSGGVVVHNMYDSEYTGVGYNIAAKEIKPTGMLRVFDPETGVWDNVMGEKELEYIDEIKKLKKGGGEEEEWEGNEYGAYGFVDKTNKFKVRLKTKPGQRSTKGSVCVEAGWNIPKLLELFHELGDLPPGVKKFEGMERKELIKEIKSKGDLKVFMKGIEEREDDELRSILSLESMNKFELCEKLEEWFKEKDLFYDMRA